MKKALAFSLVTFALPMLAAAQVLTDAADVGSLIINIINNIIVPVLFALAFIVFLWGAFLTFIVGANSDDTKEKGKNLMLWGLIGFFVMVSIWGLVNILTGTIQFSDNTGPSTLPQTGVGVQ